MLVLHILRVLGGGVELQNQHLAILVAITTDPISPLAPPQLGVEIHVAMVTTATYVP